MRDLEQNCADFVVTARAELMEGGAGATQVVHCFNCFLTCTIYIYIYISLCARWLALWTCQHFQLKFAIWSLSDRIAVKFFELKLIKCSCLWLVWLVAGCTLHAVNSHTDSYGSCSYKCSAVKCQVAFQDTRLTFLLHVWDGIQFGGTRS
jgi:hypothetical protein